MLIAFVYSFLQPPKETIEIYEETLAVDAKRNNPLISEKKKARLYQRLAFTIAAGALLWFAISSQPLTKEPVTPDAAELKWLLQHQESAIALSKQLRQEGINIPPSHLLAQWGVQTDFGRRTSPKLRSTKIEMEALKKMYIANGLSSRADSFIESYNLNTIDHDEW